MRIRSACHLMGQFTRRKHHVAATLPEGFCEIGFIATEQRRIPEINAHPVMILSRSALGAESIHVPLSLDLILGAVHVLTQHFISLRTWCFGRDIHNVLLLNFMSLGVG